PSGRRGPGGRAGGVGPVRYRTGKEAEATPRAGRLWPRRANPARKPFVFLSRESFPRPAGGRLVSLLVGRPGISARPTGRIPFRARGVRPGRRRPEKPPDPAVRYRLPCLPARAMLACFAVDSGSRRLSRLNTTRYRVYTEGSGSFTSPWECVCD